MIHTYNAVLLNLTKNCDMKELIKRLFTSYCELMGINPTDSYLFYGDVEVTETEKGNLLLRSSEWKTDSVYFRYVSVLVRKCDVLDFLRIEMYDGFPDCGKISFPLIITGCSQDAKHEDYDSTYCQWYEESANSELLGEKPVQEKS